MSQAIALPIIVLLYVLIAAVLIRALLSWFPIDPRNEWVRLLDRVTRPLLEPVRRVVPPIGLIDISAFLVIVVMYLMIGVVRRAVG